MSMPHSFQTTEAIILRTIPFRDHDRILTLFTEDAGLIKVLCKGFSKQGGKHAALVPLTNVEVIYREKRGDIFECREIHCIDSFSFLRKELLYLEVACDLLQVIASTQWMGKSSPQLYQLLQVYLKRIPHAAYPWILSLSFRMKLLKHEGLIYFPMACYECQEILDKEGCIGEGEVWCSKHKPPSAVYLEAEDFQLFHRLTTCQSFQEIRLEKISDSLFNGVAHFFDFSINR